MPMCMVRCPCNEHDTTHESKTMLKLNGMPAKVMGKVEAERPCDMCGNTTLKTAVVVAVDGTHMHIGKDCAADALRASTSRVDHLVRVAEKRNHGRWITKYLECKFRLLRISTTDLHMSPRSANRMYGKTRRPLIGSYFMSRKSLIVRVDGNDVADVAFYAALGFVQSSPVVLV